MNLPNKLTLSRIVLTFAFILFLFSNGLVSKIIALATFILASVTDVLDGFIAKASNQITDFGKLMDPVADKILILSAFLVFVEMGIVPAWMVVIIVFREAAITGLRILALTKSKIIPSDLGGKYKTAWQAFAIFVILLFLIFREGGVRVFKFWSSRTEMIYRDTIFALMCIVVVLTLLSGVSYLLKNREVYSNAKTN